VKRWAMLLACSNWETCNETTRDDGRLKIDLGLHAGDDRAEDPNVKYFVLLLKN